GRKALLHAWRRRRSAHAHKTTRLGSNPAAEKIKPVLFYDTVVLGRSYYFVGADHHRKLKVYAEPLFLRVARPEPLDAAGLVVMG
ncbi:MAG: hypothetical protein ABSG77_17380, partial [Candidatus Acidiferrum sp.]